MFFTVFQSCYKEDVVYNSKANNKFELPRILRINSKECCYDYTENSLRFSIENSIISDFSPLIEFQEYSEIYFEGRKLINKAINSLGDIEINKEYAVIIKTNQEYKRLLLTFTNLPTVQIISPLRITNDPKTLAKIIVNYTETNRYADEYFIGVEYRGGTSQSFSKKSFGFSLKGSLNIANNISGSFFEMNQNNDWILDAMWIDKARMRNKTSFEIWKKIDGDRHYGISSEFVELYINNEHQGIYCFNENINPEYLGLNRSDAVLYKATEWEDGATRFERYNSPPPIDYYWDGWEQEYPDPRIEINWQPLNDFRNFVVNVNDDVFTSQIASFINIDNFIDYYLFLNLVSAKDNTGKNTFLVKENYEDKFCIIPWDLDGSWGLDWAGSSYGYTSILSNNLFDRLIETKTDYIKNKIKQRWSYLRGNVLSEFELKKAYTDNFAIIENSGIIDIENREWESNIDINSEKEYLISWMEKRLIFLDNHFTYL